MRLARIRPADWLTGAAGVALLVFLSLDWYERPDGTVSGWEAYAVLDLLLAVVALLGLALPVITAWRATPALPLAVSVLLVAIAVLVTPFLVYRLLDQPGGDRDVDAALGAWLGVLGFLALVVADLHALRDQRAPGIPQPATIPVMAPPAASSTGPNPPASS